MTYQRSRTGDGDLDPIIQTDTIDGVSELDEFVLTNADIHFEAMDDGQWWIGVHKGERHWMLNFGVHNPRAKTYSFVEEDIEPTRKA